MNITTKFNIGDEVFILVKDTPKKEIIRFIEVSVNYKEIEVEYTTDNYCRNEDSVFASEKEVIDYIVAEQTRKLLKLKKQLEEI